jgi:hypothetical protein
VNWEAYSHEELYQMLWQDADVADVSTIATEWAQHRAALRTHAEVLREQGAALLDSWRGASAEDAAARLEKLAARVEKIAVFAEAGEMVAQEGADALAMARATMPPPGNASPFPASPVNPAPAVAPPAPVDSSMASMQSYLDSMTAYVDSMNSMDTSMFTPPPAPTWPPAPATSTTTASSADPGAGFGAVGGAGFSFYVGGASLDQQKAQAVRTMQTYESSLTRGSQLIGEARGAVPAADTMPAATPEQRGTVAATGSGGGGGVPWQRLLGGGGGTGSGSGGGPGGTAGQPGPGARVGVAPGVAGASGLAGARLAAEAAAARGYGPGGMVPPVGGLRGAGADDEKHENQLPTVDNHLFTVDEPHSRAVIGLLDGER